MSQLNYNSDILDIPYDPKFAVCGLWFDKEAGNVLKVDQFGKILCCWHGTKELDQQEIVSIYPCKMQDYVEYASPTKLFLGT